VSSFRGVHYSPVAFYLKLRKDFDFDRKFFIQGVITWSIVALTVFLAEVAYPESRDAIVLAILFFAIVISLLAAIIMKLWKRFKAHEIPKPNREIVPEMNDDKGMGRMWQPNRNQWIVIWASLICAFSIWPMRILCYLLYDKQNFHFDECLHSNWPDANRDLGIAVFILIVGILLVWMIEGRRRNAVR
jgi:hypothetical protein